MPLALRVRLSRVRRWKWLVGCWRHCFKSIKAAKSRRENDWAAAALGSQSTHNIQQRLRCPCFAFSITIASEPTHTQHTLGCSHQVGIRESIYSFDFLVVATSLFRSLFSSCIIATPQQSRVKSFPVTFIHHFWVVADVSTLTRNQICKYSQTRQPDLGGKNNIFAGSVFICVPKYAKQSECKWKMANTYASEPHARAQMQRSKKCEESDVFAVR